MSVSTTTANIIEANPRIIAHRSGWRHRGQERPAFAAPTAPGQESVWDYPRPPRLARDQRLVRVTLGDVVIAETRSAVRVLETASPPTFYIPPADVRRETLTATGGTSVCEWKGVATSYDVRCSAGRAAAAAWAYHQVFPEFAAIQGWVSFYPGRIDCWVDGERVQPQPGRFYGGWITHEIVGPWKGTPGSETW